ncbi:MAG TPA: histidine kinase [Chitinophagaceae bacterium]|nr:histidine kinase [Chitinophagaceae bacterium]HRG93635.1 histidine kinase [Chitinophagaceae bacterium]
MLFHHRYRYLFMLLLALYAFLNTALCNVYYYFKIEVTWYHALLTVGLVTFLTWEGNRLIKPYMKKRFLTARNNLRFLGFFFIAGNIIALAAAALSVYFVGGLIYGYNWEQNWNPLKLNLIYATLINLFLHLVNAILFFLREYRQKWSEAEELRRTSQQAQLQLIRSQVNPHFLFNNLNVLSGMVIKDNPEANHFIEEFSKVYRYILSNQQKELVELKAELDFVQPYLFLLGKRFEEGLEVNIRIADEYKNWHVVPAALQMLIENAIKHNVVSRQKPLHIDIHTNGNQTLVIKNNLQPRILKEPSTRTGLQNIRKRYELISGKDVMVKEAEGYFEVSLPLLRLN